MHLRRRVSLRATVALAAVTFFAVLVGSVAIQAQRIEAQARLDELNEQLVVARDEHRRLRAEVAIAESPGRIMGEATTLGMVEPGPVLPLAAVGSATGGADTEGRGDGGSGDGGPGHVEQTPAPPDGSVAEVAAP